jgi:glyoxylase-like metal-dependent hydrolase (beta-lactamase superfamily II)
VPHVLAHVNSKINQQAAAVKQKTEDKQLYPDRTYTETWCEKIGKEKICLHYFGAGHTNGDSFVHFQHSNIVHAGDLVFNRRHPYIDKAAGADISNWVELLGKATKTFDKNTIYVSGHSGTGYDTILKADEVLLFRDYLGNLLKFTEAEMKAGKSKEEILKATAIPGSPQWTGEGIQRPLTAAIEELSKK